MTIYFGKCIYCSSKALLSICEVQTQDKSLRPGMYLSKSPFLLLPYSLDIFHDEIFMLSVISEDNSEDLNIPSQNLLCNDWRIKQIIFVSFLFFFCFEVAPSTTKQLLTNWKRISHLTASIATTIGPHTLFSFNSSTSLLHLSQQLVSNEECCSPP